MSRSGGERGRGIHIVARHIALPERRLHCHKRRERHHLAHRVPDTELQHSVDTRARRLIAGKIDLIDTAEVCEVIDIRPAHIGRQSRKHIGHFELLHLDAVAVNSQFILRYGTLVERRHRLDTGISLGRTLHIGQSLLHLLRAEIVYVEQLHLKAGSHSEPRYGGRIYAEHHRLLNVGARGIEAVDHGIHTLRPATALTPRLESDKQRGVIARAAASDKRHAAHRHHRFHLRNPRKSLVDLSHHRVRAVDRCAGRELYRTHEIAHILLRDIRRRHPDKTPESQCRQREIQPDSRPRTPQEAAHYTYIQLESGGKAAVEPLIRPELRRPVLAQKHRAHGRSECKGVEAGEGRRHSYGQRKLLVKLACNTAYEGRRNKHRQQHEHLADHRPLKFGHGFLGGLTRVELPLVHQTRTVLNHHYGVIHHYGYRQHKSEQRQSVDRKAHKLHHRESGYQRHRNRDHRYDYRPPALEEDKYDQHHDQSGFDKRHQHLVYRRRDEIGSVHQHLIVHTLRKISLQLIQLLLHGLGHLQRVGAWCLVDAEQSGRTTRHESRPAVTLAAKLYAGHVRQMEHLPLRSGLDDD